MSATTTAATGPNPPKLPLNPPPNANGHLITDERFIAQLDQKKNSNNSFLKRKCPRTFAGLVAKARAYSIIRADGGAYDNWSLDEDIAALVGEA
jgi:hypothetical protein